MDCKHLNTTEEKCTMPCATMVQMENHLGKNPSLHNDSIIKELENEGLGFAKTFENTTMVYAVALFRRKRCKDCGKVIENIRTGYM